MLHRERARRGRGPWVVAVRPGFVDTPSVRAESNLDPAAYPVAEAIRRGLAGGEADSPEQAARRIWAALPPPPGESLLLFGQVPSGSRPNAGNRKEPAVADIKP